MKDRRALKELDVADVNVRRRAFAVERTGVVVAAVIAEKIVSRGAATELSQRHLRGRRGSLDNQGREGVGFREGGGRGQARVGIIVMIGIVIVVVVVAADVIVVVGGNGKADRIVARGDEGKRGRGRGGLIHREVLARVWTGVAVR
jgi:hypothetical protein